MKTVIFAAGEGTRLRPLTYTTPKPLLLINERPILFRLIDSLPDEIDEIIIVVSYLADKIIEAIAKENFSRPIKFVTMDLTSERGTWSALWRTKKFLEKDPDLFLVLNGDDLYATTDLEKIIGSNEWSLGYQTKINPGGKYRNIKVDEMGYVIDMPLVNETEKTVNIATGAYLLNREVFELEPVKTAGGEWGLPQTISRIFGKKAVKAINMSNWQQINTVDDLESVDKSLKTLNNH